MQGGQRDSYAPHQIKEICYTNRITNSKQFRLIRERDITIILHVVAVHVLYSVNHIVKHNPQDTCTINSI